MSAALNQYIELLGMNFLETSAQAALLASALIGVRLTLGRRIAPWWFATGWALVVLRLLVPVSVATPASVWAHVPSIIPAADQSTRVPELVASAVTNDLNNTQPTPLTIIQPAARSEHGMVLDFEAVFVPLQTTQHDWLERASVNDSEWSALTPKIAGSKPDQHATGHTRAPLASILFVVWATGATLLASCVIARAVLLHKLVARSTVAAPGISLLATSCAGLLGLRRRPKVRTTAQVSAPFVTGVFQPVIVLPDNPDARYKREELRCVLTHELAHIKRADVAMGWLGALAVCIHWFNPLAWLAVWFWNIDRERACDATALRALGPERTRQYGLTLIKAAVSAKSPDPRMTLAAAFSPERTSEMTRRIELLPTSSKGTRLGKIAMATSLFALAAATVTGAVSDTEERLQAAEQLQQTLKAVESGESLTTEQIASLAEQLTKMREANANHTRERQEAQRFVVQGAEGTHALKQPRNAVITRLQDGIAYEINISEDGEAPVWVIQRAEAGEEATVVIKQFGDNSFEVLETDASDDLTDIIIEDMRDLRSNLTERDAQVKGHMNMFFPGSGDRGFEFEIASMEDVKELFEKRILSHPGFQRRILLNDGQHLGALEDMLKDGIDIQLNFDGEGWSSMWSNGQGARFELELLHAEEAMRQATQRAREAQQEAHEEVEQMYEIIMRQQESEAAQSALPRNERPARKTEREITSEHLKLKMQEMEVRMREMRERMRQLERELRSVESGSEQSPSSSRRTPAITEPAA